MDLSDLKEIKEREFKILYERRFKVQELLEKACEDLGKFDNRNYEITIEDEILIYERIKFIYQALDSLNDEERDVIKKFYLEDNSLDEIATSTFKTNSKVRYLKNKAIKKLQSLVKSHI